MTLPSKDSLIARRVATRFASEVAKVATISLDTDKYDVEAELKKGEGQIHKALTTAKKAEQEIKKFEADAKRIHAECLTVLTEVKERVSALPGKAVPAIRTKLEHHIEMLKQQNWTAALTTDSEVTQFVIFTFKDIRKAFGKSRTEGVIELEKLISGKLAPLNVELSKLHDSFDKEFTKYGDDISHDIEYAEILIPHKWTAFGTHSDDIDVSAHERYNTIHDNVNREARYITLRANEMLPKLANMVKELETMHAHLVTAQREVREKLYK